MSEYTEEELRNLSRVDLRRAAVQVLGIDNRTATNHKTDELVSLILESQSGNGKSKGKGKGAPPAGKGKLASAPKEPEETEPEPPKGKAAATITGADVVKHLQAIGKGMDENHEATTEHLNELERKLYILSGLVMDLFKSAYEPDELDPRIAELDEAFQKDGEEGN